MSTARENAEAALDRLDRTLAMTPIPGMWAGQAMVCVEALRALLAETAPTEDVREALARVARDALRVASYSPAEVAEWGRDGVAVLNKPEAAAIANAILSRFHVTPKEEQ